ncbi:hypothetical protein EMIHUDRAFT_195979 [Emiliania huxleyi CCMP1516]|uniref:Glycosyltransferase 2-like domain-containing protein n=2 Tax=Emiliania huxleyi TaxID=2903 RepID=A0A0D3J392_EMIH1|nr:hypothetical protein EMIHUDRAFT_195979 [Emiliania huxleyi CCMP1516]EOD17977.1 hypothetical protein EMIHUDRAFT_195979 [Emiliania huxleyi CCMP1516]|eukprot:XP_005770406.1 hypothetical protein EMIHUDRAFT_195979 [Emiliania huxleyi CCMP1516]
MRRGAAGTASAARLHEGKAAKSKPAASSKELGPAAEQRSSRSHKQAATNFPADLHVTGSTTKCDNCNFALDQIRTEWAIFLDADTLFSTQTLIYASHLSSSTTFDFWQGRMVNPKSDVQGVFPFGAVTCMYDSDCMPNDAPIFYKSGHVPFSGRGGLWRVSVLRKVGFDHRTVGEDYDASFRAYFLYGHRGSLAPNMIFQERCPGNMTDLLRQRKRWVNADFERMVSSTWMARSYYVPRVEVFFGLLPMNIKMKMPFESWPRRTLKLTTSPILLYYGFWLGSPETGSPRFERFQRAPLFPILMMFASIILPYLVWTIRYIAATQVSLYKPRVQYLLLSPIAAFLFRQFEIYCAIEGMHRWLWGKFVFDCTPRSPSTPARQTVLSA